jgi:cation-transporting ATPase I
MTSLPVSIVGFPVSIVGQLGRAVAEGVAGTGRRAVPTRPGRAWVPVRGVDRRGGDRLARAVEHALEEVHGVHWARVNPVLAQVLVAFDDGRLDPEDLVEVVAAAEESHREDDDLPAPDFVEHPADTAPISRAMTALAADVVGLGVVAVGQVLRIPVLPVEAASAVTMVDSFGPVRRFLDARPRAATAAAIVNAALQGLGQGPLGLVVDGAHRVSTVGELSSRRRAWLAAEERMCGVSALDSLGASPPAGATETAPRPVPMPFTLAERYVKTSSLTALGGAALTLATSGNPRRTADVLLAGLPRAARLGVESFAAALSRALAEREVLVLNRAVLRRLDLIDTVVIDAPVLVTGAATVARVVPVGASDEETVAAAVRTLLDRAVLKSWAGDTIRHRGWTLAPLDQVEGGWPQGARSLARRLSQTAFGVVALIREDHVAALGVLQPEMRPGASTLIEAVRHSAQDLILAGATPGLASSLGADLTVAGDDQLADSVRSLQGEGRVVAVVSHRSGAALRASDCGIGVTDADEARPPWGADLICLHLSDAAAIIEATRLARTAGRQSAGLAAVGSAAGGIFALGSLPGAGRRAVTAVHLSTLAAMAAGTWTAAQLPPRPATPDSRPQETWHAIDVDDVLAGLGSGPEGLTAADAEGRVRPDDEPSGPSVGNMIVKELTNPLTALLGAGAALSAATGSMVDAALISGVIGLDAVIGVTQRLRTEAAIARLGRALTDGRVTVMRSGHEVVANARSLVAGDVIQLSAGDAVPADARIIDAVGLELDESSLSGESMPVAKDPKPVNAATAVSDRTSMVYAGTSVAAGRGRAVVVATGPQTETRFSGTATPTPPTGVETRLRALTQKTVPAVVAAGAGLTFNSLVRGVPLRQAVTSGVSLAAAAVPEGLPFVATVAQAAAANRLAERDVLVRNPGVLEALGRVDVLCFDKTGTLTEGHLRLTRVSDGQTDEPVRDLDPARRAVLGAALRATPRARAQRLPHPTDQAIVDGAAAARVRLTEGIPGWKKATTLPFEPTRGYHAVTGAGRSGGRLSVKGAPEVVLPRSTTWRREGRVVDLDQGGVRQKLEAEVDRLARQGLRVLAVAERPYPDPTKVTDKDLHGLELLGFVGVSDEARSSAAAPLKQLDEAGIHVVMITGDHPSTAEAVASDLGLINGRGVLTGPELDGMDDAELDAVIDTVAVFARVTPADKVRLVAAYQRAGRVVAMTGDGANDAQAIRLAHVGVAFGSRSTPAAQVAADIVIARDDLEALIETMVEGRAMWASVREALAILLGGNLGEVAFVTGAALLSGRSPLSSRQLLAVNLFTDLVPAMAISVQPPRSDQVQLAREGPDTSLSGRLARDVAIRAAATSAGAYGAWIAARFTGTPARARTVALAALVGTQLGQTMVIGRHSPLVIGSSLLSAAGLVAVIQTPGVNRFFDCHPLGPVAWGIAATSAGAATLASVVADQALP